MQLIINDDATKVINVRECNENLFKDADGSIQKSLGMSLEDDNQDLQDYAYLYDVTITDISVTDNGKLLFKSDKYRRVNNIARMIRAENNAVGKVLISFA